MIPVEKELVRHHFLAATLVPNKKIYETPGLLMQCNMAINTAIPSGENLTLKVQQ